MNDLFDILNVCLLCIFLYLACSIAYFFIFSLASHFSRKRKNSKEDKSRKMAVLIPAYKEDAVIINVARKALLQDYPKELFEIVVIADSLQPQTITKLNNLPIQVVEVSFEKSTKAKAINKCMQVIGDNYDVAVILDADNEMCSSFLKQINQAFNHGFLVVQGHRTAKNMNNSYAILDAISEEINNSIFRRGHRALGISSALIGSGMAVDYALYQETMSGVTSVGEDKELELVLLQRGYKIEYLQNAYVYDEKIQNAEILQKQRSRWLFAQLYFLKSNFFKSFQQLLKGNIDFFDKVMQQALPPRSLLLGLCGIISGLCIYFSFASAELFEDSTFSVSILAWIMLVIIFLIAILLAIPSKMYNTKTLKATWALPRGIFVMILSLLKIRKAGKSFSHTPHVYNPNDHETEP